MSKKRMCALCGKYEACYSNGVYCHFCMQFGSNTAYVQQQQSAKRKRQQTKNSGEESK